MEQFFKLKENGTNVKTEILAGVTTFMTMAYILAVNPGILKAAGMDPGAVFTATALASFIATVCMALFANKPFVLSAGMGVNAYFAYTVVLGMGYTWQEALAAVFVEGLIFIVLSLTNVREAIFNAIPPTLKVAVSVGIGFYICFIGLQNAKIVVDSATLVGMYSFRSSLADGTFSYEGISVLLALIGIIITAALLAKNVKGSMLLGILATWGIGMIFQVAGLYVPNPDAGYYSMFPSAIVAMPASLAPTFLKMDFSILGTVNFITVIFAFLFVDTFDTLGTVIGCASRADMLDEEGKLPEIRGVLLADAIGTTVGAAMGTSTVTTFVESSSGIVEGGRTGLTAITSALLFLSAVFFSPLFLAIPSAATAPAFVMVGFLMMQQITKIDWNGELSEAVPAFITIFAMPFLYSISEGISFGIISYVLMNLVMGKTKKITPLMYVLAVIFILKYVIL